MQLKYHNFCNKNVDIKFSARDSFLESPSSRDAQNRKIGKLNNLKFLGGNETKVPKHDSQNLRLRSHMPEGGEA